VTLVWKLANASASLSPVNPYLRGGNFQVSMPENVFGGEQVAGSVGGGSSTVVLSTTNRRLLDGSQVRPDSRTPAISLPPACNTQVRRMLDGGACTGQEHDVRACSVETRDSAVSFCGILEDSWRGILPSYGVLWRYGNRR
jgi:hypothetical protein